MKEAANNQLQVAKLPADGTLTHTNPLSTNSDENEISLYIITTCSNSQVRRIKKVVSKDEMS